MGSRSTDFDRCIPHLLKSEGGFTLNKRDPGNWTGGKVGVGSLCGTNMGITCITLKKHYGREVSVSDVRNMPLSVAMDIYYNSYWRYNNCEDLFPGVDFAVFDGNVNSGPGRSKKWLLASVGSFDHSVTVKRICAKRLGFLHSLSTWKTFGGGWGTRVTSVEAWGVKWALEAMKVSSISVREILVKEKEAAANSSKKNGGVAGGSAAGGGAAGTGVSTAPDAGNIPDAVFNGGAITVIVVITIAVVAYFGWKAWVNHNRAKSYNAVVNGG